MSASESELDTWVRSVGPRAIAYARSLLRNTEQAEDIVQECFCRLLRKKEEYDLPTDGLKLLFAAVTNASINLKTRRKPMVSLSENQKQGEGFAIDPIDMREADPKDRVAAVELSDAIGEALGKLTLMQRAALQLKSSDFKQHEIAEILRISPSAAGVLIHRAREAMKIHLKDFL